MTRALARRLAALLLALPALTATAAPELPAAGDCPAPALPAFSKTTVVADRVVVNGLPMQVLEARNAIPGALFLDHFRKTWSETVGGVVKPRYVEYPLSGWQVVAHREGACFFTVQVRPGALTTVALIGIGLPDQALPPSLGPEIALPGGSRLLSHMASQDRARQGDTWVAQSDRSVPEAVRFFRETLGHDGWQALTRRDPESGSATATLMFQKASRNLGIVVSPHAAGSTLVLTEQRR